MVACCQGLLADPLYSNQASHGTIKPRHWKLFIPYQICQNHIDRATQNAAVIFSSQLLTQELWDSLNLRGRYILEELWQQPKTSPSFLKSLAFISNFPSSEALSVPDWFKGVRVLARGHLLMTWKFSSFPGLWTYGPLVTDHVPITTWSKRTWKEVEWMPYRRPSELPWVICIKDIQTKQLFPT